MKTVAVFEAKNRFSELLAAVEQGDQITITRRGVPIARLVAEEGPLPDAAARRSSICSALSRLRAIRESLILEGDLKSIAREGLD
jgi:prevent-host-death family protein